MSNDNTNTIVIGFLVVFVVAIFIGTFLMVKGLKSTPVPPQVIAQPVVPTTGVTIPSITTSLTPTPPTIQENTPYIKSPLSGNPLFNVRTQHPDPLDPYATM